MLYNKGMLSFDSISYPIRKAVAKIVARARLRKLFCKRKRIYVTAEEYEKIVESLSEAMCKSGIFKQRRVKNLKKKFCDRCLYKKESPFGEWCIIKDKWMNEIKDEYCCGFTDLKEYLNKV